MARRNRSVVGRLAVGRIKPPADLRRFRSPRRQTARSMLGCARPSLRPLDRPCLRRPSPRASPRRSPPLTRRRGTPAPIRPAARRRRPRANGSIRSLPTPSCMRWRLRGRSAAARAGPRRMSWWRTRAGTWSPRRPAISRATARANTCSTTPGRTPTSAPAGATIPNSRSLLRSPRRPGAGSWSRPTRLKARARR